MAPIFSSSAKFPIQRKASCARGGGYSDWRRNPTIQIKPCVDQSGDSDEYEADRSVAMVMRIQNTTSAGSVVRITATRALSVSNGCKSCDNEDLPVKTQTSRGEKTKFDLDNVAVGPDAPPRWRVVHIDPQLQQHGQRGHSPHVDWTNPESGARHSFELTDILLMRGRRDDVFFSSRRASESRLRVKFAYDRAQVNAAAQLFTSAFGENFPGAVRTHLPAKLSVGTVCIAADEVPKGRAK